MENIKRVREEGEGSLRTLLSPPYHNTPDKCQPPRIKPNSPQLQCHHCVPFRGGRWWQRTDLPLSSKTNKDESDVPIKMDKGSFQVINFLIAFVKHIPCWKLGHGTSF